MEISKIIKSIFLCFLCLIISASVLCACSKSKENQTQNGRGNSSLGEQSSTTQTESANNNDTVVVPNVVGMNKDEAIKKLEELGLKVEIGEVVHQKLIENNGQYSFEQDGLVLSQNPEKDVVVRKGAACKISYHSISNGFHFIVKNDGTAKLTNAYKVYCPNNVFEIPKQYDGYKVSEVSASIINETYNDYQYQIKIPANLIIDGTIDVPFEYY